MTQYKTIAESNNFIVLDTYTKYSEVHEAPAVYQTEHALECEFIQDLISQGYENPCNLIRSHDEQCITGIKNGIGKQHF